MNPPHISLSSGPTEPMWSLKVIFTKIKNESMLKQILILVSPVAAAALPTGLSWAAGEGAAIEKADFRLEISVPERAVLHWDDFSIRENEIVTFIQPGESAAVLNRVLGERPSEILGRLASNGQCLLVNPNGIVFGKNSQIDVHSLVASAFDLHDSLFMKGEQDWSFARTNGNVYCYGTISAKGHVYLFGEQVGLFDGARIAVPSGKVLVGGDFQGGNPRIPNASRVYCSPLSSISADAADAGDGGTIVIWGETLSQSYGFLSARGGISKGNGGRIEVSSLHTLEFKGSIDLLAPQGRPGTLLLDPLDLTIEGVDASVTAASPFIPSSPICAPGPGHSTLDIVTLSGALGMGNVVVQTAGTVGGCPGDIIWLEGFPLSYMSTNSLTFDSANNVSILSDVTNTDAGDIFVIAPGAVFIGSAANTTVAQLSTLGNIDVNCVTGLTVTAGNGIPANAGINANGQLSINVANGNLLLDSVTNADSSSLSGNPLLVTVQGAINSLADFSGVTGMNFSADSFMTIIARDTITFFCDNSGRNENGGNSPSGFPSLIESLTGDIILENPSGQRLRFLSNFPLTFRTPRDFLLEGAGAISTIFTGTFPFLIDAGRDITIRSSGGIGPAFLGASMTANAGRDILFEQNLNGLIFFNATTGTMSFNAGGHFTANQNDAFSPMSVSAAGSFSIVSGGNTSLLVNDAMDLLFASGDIFSIQSGGNITYQSQSTGFVETQGTGGILLDSAANINLLDNSRVLTSGTSILATADINIRMAPTSLIDMIAPLVPGSTVTLVVDNAFPFSPLIGSGQFIMDVGAQIMTVERPEIAIYTARQNLNQIAGMINGSSFSASPVLYVDTATEQWCTYFPNGLNFLPFRVFYKDCLQQAAAQAAPIVAEMLENYHPYSEYPGWWSLFSVASQLPDTPWTQPFFLTRRQLQPFNNPKSYTVSLHEFMKRDR